MVQEIGSDPYVDWFIMVIVTTVICLCLIVAGVFTYQNVGERLAEPSIQFTGDRSLTIDEGMLSHVLEQFAKRSTEREIMLKNYTGVSDPGL